MDNRELVRTLENWNVGTADAGSTARIIRQAAAALESAENKLIGWNRAAEAAEARADELRNALVLVMPMARAYAAEHPVGSNAQYVFDADAALSAKGSS